MKHMSKVQYRKQMGFNSIRRKALQVLERDDLTPDERARLRQVIIDIPGWEFESSAGGEFSSVLPTPGFGFTGFPEKFG